MVPVQERDFSKIEVKHNMCINAFGSENKLDFSIQVSDQKFADSVDLLLLINNDKSHYLYIIDLKNKNKKWFCRICLQCFSSESLLIKHKENCLNINGKPSVKLEKGIIKFENYFKQIPVPFKIYAGFECNLRGVECQEDSYTKKYQDRIPCCLVDDRFTKQIVVYRCENAAY